MSAILSIATSIGAPFIEKILTDRFGAAAGEIGGRVLREIADVVGVPVGGLEDAAIRDPEKVGDAIRAVEGAMPEMLPIYLAEAEARVKILEQEAQGPIWAWAWRPAWMWGLFALWLWNVVALHVLNAIFKIALPQMDLSVLLQLTGIFLALYMGGHTVKAVAEKWGAR